MINFYKINQFFGGDLGLICSISSVVPNNLPPKGPSRLTGPSKKASYYCLL